MLELPEALVLAGQINERARGRRVVRAEAGGRHTPPLTQLTGGPTKVNPSN